MKVLLFCSESYYTIKVIQEILDRKLSFMGIVCPPGDERLLSFCEENHIRTIDPKKIEEYVDMFEAELDSEAYLFSYLNTVIIPKSLIDLFGKRAVNFHPGPLPEHRGVAGCTFSLLEKYNYWGVTAHQLVEQIDAGDIIEKQVFPIDQKTMFATDVYYRTQKELFLLFQNVLSKLIGGYIVYLPQEKLTGLKTRKELQRIKQFIPTDNVAEINNKIQALWLPPYHGLSIEVDGETFTLINEKILKELASLYQEKNGVDL